MLRHADAVAIGDLGDRDAFLDRGLQIDVIRADARSDRELELLRLCDPLRRQVAGQNGCEMTISASGNSRSKTEFSPSLSEVTMRV